MAQTSYTKHSTPRNGQVAESRPDTVIVARRAEGALTAGYCVTLGTDPETQVDAVTGGAATFGIFLPADSETDGAVANDEANVMRKGAVYVTCATAFTAGTAVYSTDATGAIRSNATGGTVIPNAVFLSTGGAGAVAKIELDLVGS